MCAEMYTEMCAEIEVLSVGTKWIQHIDVKPWDNGMFLTEGRAPTANPLFPRNYRFLFSLLRLQTTQRAGRDLELRGVVCFKNLTPHLRQSRNRLTRSMWKKGLENIRQRPMIERQAPPTYSFPRSSKFYGCFGPIGDPYRLVFT